MFLLKKIQGYTKHHTVLASERAQTHWTLVYYQEKYLSALTFNQIGDDCPFRPMGYRFTKVYSTSIYEAEWKYSSEKNLLLIYLNVMVRVVFPHSIIFSKLIIFLLIPCSWLSQMAKPCLLEIIQYVSVLKENINHPAVCFRVWHHRHVSKTWGKSDMGMCSKSS